MKSVYVLILLLAVSMISGCASVSRGSKQQVRLNAYDVRTNNVIAADCFLTNDEGITYSKSNKSTVIGRDKDPLTVYCHTDSFAGKSTIEGKINGGFLAADFFLLDFCIISGWVDGLSGSWAEYPDNIDIALDSKTDSYHNMLEGTLLKLKEQIATQSKNGTTLPSKDDPNYSYVVENKDNLEKSQYALKLLELELSSKK
jgi:hypothetical protein